MNKEELSIKVYEIVKDIPPGRVLTYGLLAMLCGMPNNSRLIGKIMSEAPRDLSSHRVVNHMGRTVPGWTEQRAYLEAEGIKFKANGCVDMKKHLWRFDH